MSASVWGLCVEVPRGKEGLQDDRGRLWDVVWMLRMAARRGGSDLRYRLSVVTAKGRRNIDLKTVCGPGDDAEPVITIMLPEEE